MQVIEDHHRVRRAPGLLLRPTAVGHLALPPEAERPTELTGPAAAVVLLLHHPRPVASVIEDLAGDAEQAEEVRAAVRALVESHILEVSESPGTDR